MTDSEDAKKPIKAIIADDHPLVLLAIEHLLSSVPNMQVVGRAVDATQLFSKVSRIECDIVVADLYMPGGLTDNAMSIIDEFKCRFPHVALVILTMETKADVLQQVIAHGADAVISKEDRIDLIHVAIVSAIARECYVGPVVRSSIADATLIRRRDYVHSVLSRRELDVFTQYASGMGVTEIASRLGRSVKTISAQKCTAMRKLSLHSDAELFRFAAEHGVIPEDRQRRRS
ncbi:response regulator transcription factor [Paraburkholderia sp.]|uniref:response regulator transcription factor n=1 Tax=Paraburkholderia sp. TaxID=1926495 RepID=UPI00238F8771|nr:response regulator transcription factor [Paraburkholderia sp.]MDE1179619.1 response regulator transcription factor [Paraburkholderia sp.]